MKKSALFGVIAMTSFLGACATNYPSKTAEVANPASEFCVKQGGKSEIRKDQNGDEYGVCVLPDGQVVEKWEYFRKHSQK